MQKESGLAGPARGYETGIRGLLGGEMVSKSYSVEGIRKQAHSSGRPDTVTGI